MGQSLSRRPAPPSVPTGPGHANDTNPPRRSLPRRILSSIPKPSLRSRALSASLSLPTRSEQTLRGKNRRWRLSRRHNVSTNTQSLVPEHMDPLTEHDENQVDRDVDEFGVITHRVPDSTSHSDSSAAPTKGKEKAKDVPDIEVENEDIDKHPIPSTSTSSPPLAQSGPGNHDPAEAVIAPTRPPSPLIPQEPTPPLPFIPMPAPPPPPLSTGPRPFPPPGTLVVVQGVVHTTDVPRSSDHPGATSNPTPSSAVDPPHSNTNTSTETDPTRPSSVPPGTRSRNPLSGILPRPTSMVPAVPSSPPSDSTVGSSNIDSQARQTTEDSDGEDRTHTHPHGISIAQGPVGASGLSASSIDVLGTLLSVAAAATAASLLTGSSEPIFSSGLTSSPPPPSSNPITQPVGFNPHVPSERPLSPTPTSDAGRMRHVWSSLRDRLGLGSGAHNPNHSSDATSNLAPGQNTPSQPSAVVQHRDPREIMLAEMARAFNLGLGLGGASTSSSDPPANTNSTELATPDEVGDVPAGEQPLQPPPDSFERFLMDLQTDLRVTLMQEHEPGVVGGAPPDVDETAEDVEDDQPIPELRSISDSDSEEFGTNSDERDELDCEDNVDNEGDEEEERAAQEVLSGRASPAVSALGTGACYPCGIRTNAGSPSFGVSGISPPHTGHSPPISTVFPSTGASDPVPDNDKNGDMGTARASSSVSTGLDGSSPSEVRFEGESKHQGEGAASGMVHSQEASNRESRAEAEGYRAVSGGIAVPPLDVQDPSNVAVTGAGRESFGTSSTSGDTHNSFSPSSSTTQASTHSSPLTSPPLSNPEPTTHSPSLPNQTPGDSSMPFRLPFTSSSASRTEHTPGGGINWWRMYRFPAIASPNLGQPWGPQGSSPLSQPTLRNPVQGPTSSTDSWTRTLDHNQQNEMMTSLGVPQAPGVQSGPVAPLLTPSATPSNMSQNVFASSQSTTPPSTNGQEFSPPTNASNTSPEHRSNVVVPVIVVGLQSVNMDRHHPHIPHPHAHANHGDALDEDGEGVEFDGLEHPMSMPLHIPEPPEFRHHPISPGTIPQEQGNQQPARGRTWQSRAANAIRNLRPSRRNADATSPQPQETPGSRTFLIYVIGGYYPPDHQIITGGNLDSFEALWELAELLGQVKPPTVSKEEIEKSGLEIIKASLLEEYEGQGRVASNCIDRCLICLDDYDPEDELRVLSCKHTFHRGCVDRWLETGRNNCPACRTKGVGNESAGPTPAASATA